MVIIGAADVAEEGGVHGGAGDGEVADGFVVAVVVSAEAMGGACVADGAHGLAVHVDGCGLLEVHAVVGRAAVHVGGQLLQVAGVRDFVGGGLGALAAPCPRRLCGAECEEQHGGCPRGVSDGLNDVVHTFICLMLCSCCCLLRSLRSKSCKILNFVDFPHARHSSNKFGSALA